MRADFYFIPDTDRNAFVCRLINKAYEQGRKIYVYAADAPTANMLDEQLWTFRQHSFIPHAQAGQYSDAPPPVEIGHVGCPTHHNDVLINLNQDIPDFVTRFQRVVEIVAAAAPAEERQTEQRLQHYKQRQFDIHEHRL